MSGIPTDWPGEVSVRRGNGRHLHVGSCAHQRVELVETVVGVGLGVVGRHSEKGRGTVEGYTLEKGGSYMYLEAFMDRLMG